MPVGPYSFTFGEGVWGAVPNLKATASGSSTTAGSAAARIPKRRATASGASSTAGTANPKIPKRRVSASGSSTTVGSAQARLIRRVSASGASTTSGSASAVAWARAEIPPDTILAVTNLPSSPVSNVTDDPDSPDGSWLLATSATTATAIRFGFQSPGGDLMTGSGHQKFRVLLRES